MNRELLFLGLFILLVGVLLALLAPAGA